MPSSHAPWSAAAEVSQQLGLCPSEQRRTGRGRATREKELLEEAETICTPPTSSSQFRFTAEKCTFLKTRSVGKLKEVVSVEIQSSELEDQVEEIY